MTGAYAPQRQLSDLSPAQSRLGALIQGVFVIEVGWILGGALWLGLWSPWVGPGDTTRLAGLVTLMTHGVLLAVVLLVVQGAQRRGFRALIGPWRQAVADFGAVLRWSGGLALAAALLGIATLPDSRDAMQPLGPWLLTLPVILGAILVQTTAEELYFRGYIQSTLAARFARPVIWMGAPSLFFGLLHWQSGAGPVETAQVVLITGSFGLCAADLTARTGTLGAAVALHFAYNALLLVVSNVAGEPFSGLALFLLPPEARIDVEAGPFLSLDLIAWLGMLAILWLAARNAVRR